jgi:hypothetical protein
VATRTDIHRHEERLTEDDAHQLSHGRLPLEVQPSGHATDTAALVDLHEGVRQSQISMLGELVRPIDLHEEAALVLEDLALDEQDLGQRGAADMHLHGLVRQHTQHWRPLGAAARSGPQGAQGHARDGCCPSAADPRPMGDEPSTDGTCG